MFRGAFPADGCQHAVEALENLLCRETEHDEAAAPRLGLRTTKGFDRHRSDKLAAVEVVTAQSRPEQSLGPEAPFPGFAGYSPDCAGGETVV